MSYKAVNNKGKCFIIQKLFDSCYNEKNVEEEVSIVGMNLKHDHIVRIIGDYYIGKVDRHLVMEYCDGGHLGDFMVSNKPDVMTRLGFMLEISQGICFLHTQGIIHRDIKPESIYLGHKAERLVCKVADFGLSIIKKSRHHVFSSQVESFPYLAPEILEGKSYNNSVDVFSLGMLFYATINNVIVKDRRGKKIFTPAKVISDSRYEYLNSIMQKENPSLIDFLKSYFVEFEDTGGLVYNMIQTNDAERPGMDFVLLSVAQAKDKHITKLSDLSSVNICLNNDLCKMKESYKKIEEDMLQKDKEHKRIQQRLLGQMLNLKIDIGQLKEEKSHLEEKMKMVEWNRNTEDSREDGNKNRDHLNRKPSTRSIQAGTLDMDNAAVNTAICDEKVIQSQEKIHTREWNNQTNTYQNTKRMETNAAVTMDVLRTSLTHQQRNLSVHVS